MRWRESEGGVIIENWTEFDPKLTFKCGQAFRWEGEGDRWVGTVSYTHLDVYKRQAPRVFMIQ